MVPKQLLTFLLILISCSAFAQIKHNTTLFYDFDGDGTEDISFEDGYWYNGLMNTNFYFISVSAKNGIEIAATGEEDIGANLLEFNDTINQNLNWTDKSVYITHGYIFPNSKWKNETDNFIAVKLLRNDSIYFGWIRVKKGISLDAGIQLVPNAMIKAGEGIQSIAPLLKKANDVYDNGNWSDIEVEFYSPYYSALLKEYRLFVIKDDDSHRYSADELLALPETHYQHVDTGLIKYEVRLNADMLDVDGNRMENSGTYKIGILSVSNEPETFPHDFSFSPPIEINTILPEAGKPVALDKNNSGTSQDLFLTFAGNSREEATKEYRLQIVPIGSADLYNLENASAVPAENTWIVEPEGDSVYTVKDAMVVDIYGNSVEQNKIYKAFIYSVPDMNQSNIGSLSEASNSFCLGIPNYFFAGQMDGEKINYVGFEPVLAIDDTIKLDFDNDGTDDFTFTANEVQFASRYVGKSQITTENNTEIIITENNNAANLQEYAPINQLTQWGSGTFILAEADGPEQTGEFPQYEGNIGFRKLNSTDTIYGWIHINALKNAGIIDYAWKGNSNQPNTNKSSFISYPNPNIDKVLNITLKDFQEGEEYFGDIFNSSGTKLKSFIITEKLFKINLAGLQKGTYYLRLRNSDTQETQKIMVF